MLLLTAEINNISVFVISLSASLSEGEVPHVAPGPPVANLCSTAAVPKVGVGTPSDFVGSPDD